MSGLVRLWAARCFSGQAISLVLLLIVFGSLVYGVSDAVRGLEPGFLWPLVLMGLLLGWVMACSRLPGWLVAMLGSLAGACLALLRVGQLGDAVSTLLARAANLAWQTVQGSFPPDTMAFQVAWAELADNVGAIAARLYTWLLNLIQGQPLYDPLPVALLWSLALWATVFWAC
ncbi:MAG: hypothetical protein PVI80_10315, partial [Anaerolineae bacterium]